MSSEDNKVFNPSSYVNPRVASLLFNADAFCFCLDCHLDKSTNNRRVEASLRRCDAHATYGSWDENTFRRIRYFEIHSFMREREREQWPPSYLFLFYNKPIQHWNASGRRLRKCLATKGCTGRASFSSSSPKLCLSARGFRCGMLLGGRGVISGVRYQTGVRWQVQG